MLAAGALFAARADLYAATVTPALTEGPYYTFSSADQVVQSGSSHYDSHFYTTQGTDNDLTHKSFADAGGSAHGAYLYDFASRSWWYTSPTAWPYLYDFGSNAWLYYFPNSTDSTHYTSNPRYFYNFSTKANITK